MDAQENERGSVELLEAARNRLLAMRWPSRRSASGISRST
jgi:hypothetical protein